VDFWTTEYPALTNIEGNLVGLRLAGFDPLGRFILPSEDWANYYGPVQEQLVAFRSENSQNAEAQAFADSLQREADVWKECGSSYGYVFYLGRAI
jgi:hypothetical protein